MRTLAGVARNRADISFAPPRTFAGLGNLFTPGVSPASRTDQMEMMGGVGTLFAVVHAECEPVAGTQWALFEKNEDDKAFDPEPWSKRKTRPKHPAAALWAKPNEYQTRQQFVATVQQHYELTGEGWAWIERDERFGMPKWLWPLRPDKIEVVSSERTPVAGYLYTNPNGDKVPIPVTDMLRLWNQNPIDPCRGMGPVQTIMADLEGAKLTAEWNANFFRNAAQPGGIVQVDHRLGPDQFEELRAQWNAQHRGTANAGRVAILADAKWVESKFTQSDMQFDALRRGTVDQICAAFRVAKSKIGIVEDVNRANGEVQDVAFARDHTRPRLEMWKSALDTQLLPLFYPKGKTPDVEFEFPDPVLEDSESQVRVLQGRAVALRNLIESGFAPGDATAQVGLGAMKYIGRPAKVGGEAVIVGEEGEADPVPTTTPTE